MKGTCTLDKFKEVEKNEELHQELQRCGLTEDEISDYFAFHRRKVKYFHIRFQYNVIAILCFKWLLSSLIL